MWPKNFVQNNQTAYNRRAQTRINRRGVEAAKAINSYFGEDLPEYIYAAGRPPRGMSNLEYMGKVGLRANLDIYQINPDAPFIFKYDSSAQLNELNQANDGTEVLLVFNALPHPANSEIHSRQVN